MNFVSRFLTSLKFRKLFGVTGLVSGAGLLALAAAPIALACTPSVYAVENCSGWTAEVTAQDNFSGALTLTVTSTIPGTPGSTVTSYTASQSSQIKTGKVLWGPYSGKTQVTGEVTAKISPEGTSGSAYIAPAKGCSTPTPTPTPTPHNTPTPTPTPHNTPTPTPTPHNTPTPTPTPHNTPTPTPTPHNTPTPTPTPTTPIVPRTPTTPTTGSGLLLPGIIGLLAVIGGLSLLAIDRKLSYKKN